MAFDIYGILRTRVRLDRSKLTHAELLEKLASPFNELDADSPLITTALKELATSCRMSGLPSITAMVEEGDAKGERDDDPASDAELTEVRSSKYPPSL